MEALEKLRDNEFSAFRTQSKDQKATIASLVTRVELLGRQVLQSDFTSA